MSNSKKRKGLGSMGVDVLLSSPSGFNSATSEKDVSSGGQMLTQVAVERIDTSPYQPRMKIDAATLETLAESIRSQGIIQPIVVRKMGNRFELIAGERRWRAAQLAGLTEVPAVIKEADDTAAAAMSLVENIQREQLNPIEEAAAIEKLISTFKWTHQQVAEAIGRARATVSNTLRLLDLVENVRALVAERVLDMGHARALLGLPAGLQSKAGLFVAENGLSVRETEKYVRKLLNDSTKEAQPVTERKDPNISHLEQTLADQIGAPVEIRHSNKSGKGTLKIRYSGLDELEGILERFR